MTDLTNEPLEQTVREIVENAARWFKNSGLDLQDRIIVEGATTEIMALIEERPKYKQVAWMNIRNFPHSNEVHDLMDSWADEQDEKDQCVPLYIEEKDTWIRVITC